MTPKEALEVLFNNLDQAKLKESSSSDYYWTKYEEVNEAIKVLENSITEVENPPKQSLFITLLKLGKRDKMTTLEQRALNGLANFIIMHGNNDDFDASAIEWHGILKTAIIELEDLRESHKEMRRLLDEAYAKLPHNNDTSKGEL